MIFLPFQVESEMLIHHPGGGGGGGSAVNATAQGVHQRALFVNANVYSIHQVSVAVIIH